MTIAELFEKAWEWDDLPSEFVNPSEALNPLHRWLDSWYEAGAVHFTHTIDGKEHFFIWNDVAGELMV